MTIIDVNCFLGRWPFQRFAVNTPRELARHLAREGITAAWVSAMESVLHPDPDVYDALLARKLRPHDTLHFVKTVHPMLGNWRAGLRRWGAEGGAAAVKVFPGYHGYSLRDRRVAEMMAELRRLRLGLLVQMRVEDERSHYPLMKVPPVACADVAHLARAFGRVPIVALSAYLPEARQLVRAGSNVYVDLSFMEAPDTLAAALAEIPAGRILFGSCTPLLCTRSAAMKMEMAAIPAGARRAIASGNARRILKPGRKR